MNKKVINAALLLVSILSFSFGFYQKMRADNYQLKAIENEVFAQEMKAELEKMKKLAEHQRVRAEAMAREAMRQHEMAESKLKAVGK